jgi:ABC-type nitrate/sulfonate/bicarbonate transport system substrate-binding protein
MKKTLFVIVIIAALALIGVLINVKHQSANQEKNLPAPKMNKVRVQAGWLINGEFANFCSALVNGFYKEQNLDVELIPGGPVGASFVIATNAVAQDNSLTLGIDGDMVPLMRGVTKENESEKLKVKAFAAFWNQNPYGFIVRADSGLNSIKDFIKRKPDGSKYKIGVSSDSVAQYAIAKYLNVPVTDLNIVIVGFDATPLLTRQVDALAGFWTTQVYEVEKAGVPYKFLSASELPGWNQQSQVAIATDNTLRDKKDILERWLKATIKGTEFVEKNPEIAAENILDNRCGGPALNKEQELWVIKKSIPLFDQTKPGWVYENQAMDFAQAYKNLGQIPSLPKSSDVLDYSILNSIYKN